MKKKILFCIENFQHGGINRALENLLTVIDYSEYEPLLFVVNQEDGPYKQIFSKYLCYDKDVLLSHFCTNYRKYSGLKKYALLGIKTLRKLTARVLKDPFAIRLDYWRKRISADSFDCVIAYAEGYITEFVSKIECKKVAWIHIDYKRYLVYTHNLQEKEIYSKFQNVVIPSKFAASSFEDIFPEFKDKIRVIPNSIDSDVIRKLADTNGKMLDPKFKTDLFTIISVGRICYEKRFLIIPEIADKLRKLGVKFRWYIIGDGSVPETAAMNNEIEKYKVSELVIHLGRKYNPYPYIKKSDLLVSTSLSETFSYVIFEAKSLGIPIVSADFGTAPEVLFPNEGIISSMESMAESIHKMIIDKDFYSEIQSGLVGYSYDNKKIQEQITCMLQS